MVMPEDDAGIVALLRVNIPYAAPLSLLAADRIEAQAAEIVRLRAAIKRQASAVRTLQANEQTEINILRAKRHEWYIAISSLDSEREANALLTAEIERLREVSK
jgi:hypothetical protein